MIKIESYNQKISINDNCFDILRAVCILTVFLGHFITHFNVPSSSILFEIAYFIRGVPVFFLLSGLFIARSLERYSTSEFVFKRIFRIFPELWVCVLLNLIIILISYDGNYTMKDIFVYLVTQMSVFQFYTGDWLRGYGVGAPNGALWTVTVDIQFYILAIFIAKFMKNKSLKFWISIIAMFSMLNLIIANLSNFMPTIIWKLLQCSVIPYMYIFLIGMMSYYYKDLVISWILKFRWMFWGGYIIWNGFVPEEFVSIFDGVRYNLVTTILLIMGMLALGFSFKYRVKVDYSYSFYLYHMVVLNVINHNILKSFNSGIEFVECFLVSFLITLILAYVSKQVVDFKMTKYLEKRIKLYLHF